MSEPIEEHPWSTNFPRGVGLYMYRCMETDDQPEFAAIIEEDGMRFVCEESMGKTLLSAFHTGLTYIHWKKIA